MKKFIYLLLLFYFMATCSYAEHRYATYQFTSTAQTELFHKFLQQTRCIVCQGQNLADSNAPLANDLRQKIYNLIKANKSEEEINLYLTKRYGDFILLDPPLKKITVLLWFFPLTMLLVILFFFFRFLKRYQTNTLSS